MECQPGIKTLKLLANNRFINDKKGLKMFSKTKVYLEPLSSLIRYLPKNGKILDAGCGDCFFAHKLKKFNNNILCLDIVHSTDNTEDGLPYCRGSISNLPLKSNSMDFIYCITVIQYITDDAGVINEFFRVLKPQGKLLITVPTRRSLFRLIREMEIYCDVYPFQASFNVRPYEYYTRKMIDKLLNNKFNIIEFRGYEYNFFPRLGSFFLNCARKNRYFEKFSAKSMTLIQQKGNPENPITAANHDVTDDRRILIPKRQISKIPDLSCHYLIVLEKR